MQIMRSKILIISLFLLGFFVIPINAQKIYSVTSGEIIFSENQASFTTGFLTQYPDAKMVSSNLRFTMFFHVGQYVHYDINNVFGLYTGLAIRNVGMITNETLPQTVGSDTNMMDYKIVNRQYMLGLPLAIKLGSFKDHFYIFGGAEYELAFNYKQKYWVDEDWDRDGSKTKYNKWFGDQTPIFLPSVFGGIQFPGGVNVKVTYYLEDLLNNEYTKSSNLTAGNSYDVSDLSRYEESRIFMISLCWQFKTTELFGEVKPVAAK